MKKRAVVDKKRRSFEAKEIIESIGAPGKEGVKAAKEYFSSEDKKDAKIKEATKDILTTKRKHKEAYIQFLASQMVSYLRNIPWTTGWQYKVNFTEQGIVLFIQAPNKKIFGSAFKVTGDANLDVNALDNFVLRAENLFDLIEEQNEKSPGGIILPK